MVSEREPREPLLLAAGSSNGEVERERSKNCMPGTRSTRCPPLVPMVVAALAAAAAAPAVALGAAADRLGVCWAELLEDEVLEAELTSRGC